MIAFGRDEPWPWNPTLLLPDTNYFRRGCGGWTRRTHNCNEMCGPWPRPRGWDEEQARFLAHQHLCTSRCPFFKHRDVYICCWNGNYHVCTDIMCDRKVEMADANVCSLTSLSYPLDWGRSWDQPGGTDDASTNYRARVNSANGDIAGMKKKNKRKRAGDGLSVPIPLQSPNSSDDSPSTPRHARVRQRASPLVERPIVNNLLRFVLPQLTDAQRDELQTTILSLWEKVQTTTGWAETLLSDSYKLDTHTLTVLHFMKTGGSHMKGIVVVAPNPLVCKHLANIDKIPTTPLITNAARKLHRTHAGRFQNYMYEWCDKYKAAQAAAAAALLPEPPFVPSLTAFKQRPH